jgi:hypothetical protein
MNLPIQMNLFDQPTFNVARDVKAALKNDAFVCGLSREQIVERMNVLAERHGVVLTHGNGKGLTLEVFEKWLNPSDMSRHMPVKALPLFCAVAGNCSALDVLARPMGLRVIGEREQKILDWAEAKLTVKEQSRKIRKLESEI